MTISDPLPEARASWGLLAERAASEPDPRRRANLEVVARHVEEEVRGDVPALMATLVAQPRYEIWGASASTGPKGYDAVVKWYEDSIAIGKNRLEFEIARVAVDGATVVTEGVFRHAYTGAVLAGKATRGTAELEEHAWYAVEYRALVVWPISREGLIEGEHVYVGEPPRVLRRLSAGECPHLGPVDRA
ncbi:nuclear transport factor 2 family protein [Actinomadura sp. LD22]|uniref:Nuclear transport factor 2 family protein n=1 Tax=Actinomadura physcomitrii TaxID=2650748 RepID=A0A6I4MAD0_9ACTN|nr:nuclear transport factor 2 family protein [Actinomadura physcomitrii]MWA03198.1 nuclear transport factor 2 family protein [Actinomadura physcomitrii]